METDLSNTESVDVNTDELKKQLESVLNEEYEAEEITDPVNNTVDTMIETALTESTVYWENITSEKNEQYDECKFLKDKIDNLTLILKSAISTDQL